MADRSRRGDSRRIGLIESIRRRTAFVAICTLAVAAGVLVVSLLEDPVYEAQTSVLISASEDSQPSPTQALAFSDADEIARSTGAELGGVDAASIVGRTQLSQGGAPDLLTVTAEAGGPLSATQLANAYAEQFVSFVDDLPDFRGRAEVVEKAVPPDSPESPQTVRNTLLGALAGLLLGVVVAFAWARLDRRVRAAREFAGILGAPLLGTIPKSQSLALDEGLRELPAADAEAFRMVRVSIHHSEVDREIRSVVLTSARPGGGKTAVAFGLAAVAATSGERVLLIEADMRRSGLEAIVPPPPAGLSSVLDGRADLLEVVSAVEVSTGADASGTVDVVHAGPASPDPTRLLESERMIEVLAEAERKYDLVVVDTPAVRVLPDAIPLFGRVDGVVVVARLGRDRREDLRELGDRLRDLDAPVIGAVANFAAAPDESCFEHIRAHEAAVAEAGTVPLQPEARRTRRARPARRARRRRRAEPAVKTPRAAVAPLPDGPVDLNAVSYEELLALDLSNTQARRLIAYRERAGGFSSIDDLDEVPGFPDGLRAALKQRVRLDS
jgi:capsular exopolysaccharide synthesis family protein